MCGRYTLIADAETLTIEFELLDVTPFLSRRYNIAPTQDAPVVRVFNGRRQLASMRWSFQPSWADEPKPGPPLINARSETVATSPAFRAAFRRRRCIVPCSGFYEWGTVAEQPQAGSTSFERATQVEGLSGNAAAQVDSAKAAERTRNWRVPSQRSLGGKPLQGSLFEEPAEAENDPPEIAARHGKANPGRQKKPPAPRKQPYLIRPRGGDLFALAGIWETWESRAGEVLDTFAILTTTPNRVMAELHNRMPVILDRANFGIWLDPALEAPDEISPLLMACADEKLELIPVSNRVNSVRFDDEGCIAPLTG